MKTYFVKTPKIIQSIFSDYTWKIKTNKKEIYLTFDDGPISKITPWVLQTLDEFNAKATFFCVGENIKKHLEIFKEIVSKGHGIGNHTFNHLNGWKTDSVKYLKNIEKTKKLFDSVCENNNRSRLFRPPYGKIKKNQAKELIKNDYQIVMWSILSGDFNQNMSKENCLENIINNTKKGNIIVFHDSLKAFENLKFTLPKVLKYYSEKGYTFKTLPKSSA